MWAGSAAERKAWKLEVGSGEGKPPAESRPEGKGPKEAPAGKGQRQEGRQSGSNRRRKETEVEKPREKKPRPSCLGKHPPDADEQSQTNRQTGLPGAPRIRVMCGIRSEVT